MQEGLWNLSFFVDKDSILIKVGIFKNYMDSEMINPWTQVKSYHGHFEISQTFTMIEMAKAYDLNVYKYLNFLLEKRPNARTAQKELEKLAPWNEEVQKMFARKMK